MLHALVEEWGKGEKSRKRHDSLGLADGSEAPEPNTRATTLPLRAHTLLHKWTHGTRDIMDATPKSRGYRHIDRKRRN